jgi:surface protein
MSNWGKGVNNDIGWGQGANNDIGWGSIYDKSYAGETLLGGGGNTDAFIIEVKTDNAGTTNDNQFQFTGAVGDYNVVAKQNDIVVQTFSDLSDEATITFANGAGTYVLEVNAKPTNGFDRLAYRNGGDKRKLTKLIQWGIVPWPSLDSMFWGCSNISYDYTDIPNLSEGPFIRLAFAGTNFNQPVNNWDVSNITDMNNAFRLAGNFNQPVNNWDVSNVTDMSNMFWGASSFNQPLDNWDVSSVTSMSNMFLQSNLSVENLTAIYTKWSQLNLQQNVSFSAGNTKYNASGQAGRDLLVNTYNWIITDGGQV